MCFSLQWVQQVLIWLVIVAAIVALLRLVVPWVLGQLGIAGGVIPQAINIVLWAIIACFVIYFVFDLIGCLAGSGGGLSFPRHR